MKLATVAQLLVGNGRHALDAFASDFPRFSSAAGGRRLGPPGATTSMPARRHPDPRPQDGPLPAADVVVAGQIATR
jgi:hypothetical protein